MYLLLEKPGSPPQRIKIEGDQALIGRAAHCDLVIDEEFVSKQHLRIFRGVVAIDLSTNGTFVEGERIVGGVALSGRPLQIARSQITIRVEDEVVPAVGASSSTSRDSIASAVNSKGLTVLRRELEEAASRVAAKEQARAELAAAFERAQHELQTLRSENAQLRTRAEELASAEVAPEPQAPADSSAASLLLFKLQRENAQLKRALAQAGPATPTSEATTGPVPPPRSNSAPAVAPVPLPPPWAPASGAGSSAPVPPVGDGIVPVARDSVVPPPVAGASSPRAAQGGTKASVGASMVLARLSELVNQDVEAMAVRPQDPLDAFLAVEGYRFLRRVERMVTRLAGGLIQLYQLHTMVPGVEGNLRDLLGAVLANPGGAAARDELLGYLKELGRWMVVSLSAHRVAAERFAAQLKNDLTAEALTSGDPISVVKRVSGKSDAELWRRVSEYLRDLTPERINERIEKLAREVADELADKDASQAFP